MHTKFNRYLVHRDSALTSLFSTGRCAFALLASLSAVQGFRTECHKKIKMNLLKVESLIHQGLWLHCNCKGNSICLCSMAIKKHM